MPAIEGTIPIHIDLLMGASIIAKESLATWEVGGDGVVESKKDRKAYVHLPMRTVADLRSGCPTGRCSWKEMECS